MITKPTPGQWNACSFAHLVSLDESRELHHAEPCFGFRTPTQRPPFAKARAQRGRSRAGSAAAKRADPKGLPDRASVETLYSTGIRRGDCVQLNLYDIDLRSGTDFIRQGKGKRDRIVPIGDRAMRWIGKYLCKVGPGSPLSRMI